MSVRLRLTLLYSVILALTLTGFGGMLYGTQARSMRAGNERTLAETARRLAGFWQPEGWPFDDRQFEERPFRPPMPPGDPVGPSREFGFRTIYVQIIDLEGQVVDQSENLDEAVLPLSNAGLEAVLSGRSWVETASVEGERLLIHSEPVRTEQQITEILQVAHTLAEQDQYLGTLRRNLLVGSGVAIVIAFGAGWVLSGLVLRPVDRITQTARAIGAERDLSRRVEHTGPNDEIGQLATTFNAMLTELQAAYQQQKQFVADVSHELRTPLTTLRGNLALLRRQPSISTEDKEDILDDMVGESDRLIRLVSDLLALARAESGQPLRSEFVRLKPLVEDVCRQARLLDADRTITCEPLPDVTIVGEQDALKQVLLILVDNALKHTSGPITVSTIADEPPGMQNPPRLSVTISIRDSGPGIAPEMMSHVFERFCRGEDTRDTPGLGLGLPIAKALVEAQGGKLTIDSQVDRGSVVTVTLPQAVAPNVDSEAA
jgi:two-component system OmpR family sensor kinase